MVETGTGGPYQQLGGEGHDEYLVGVPGQVVLSENHFNVV